MKIELKDSEVGEFQYGRDTELWVATRWTVFSSSYCIVIKTKKFYCMKPLYLKIIVLIVANPQWVGDSSMSLLPSVDMPIKQNWIHYRRGGNILWSRNIDPSLIGEEVL